MSLSITFKEFVGNFGNLSFPPYMDISEWPRPHELWRLSDGVAWNLLALLAVVPSKINNYILKY